MTQYVGRVSFKHYEGDLDAIFVEAKKDCLSFAVEMGEMGTPCFIFEVGECGEPHAHFYFRTTKSLSTVQRILKRHFRLPPKVCAL